MNIMRQSISARQVKAALFVSVMFLGTGAAQAQSQSSDYHPGQSFTFKPTPGTSNQASSTTATTTTTTTSANQTAAGATAGDANDANERRLNFGKIGSFVGGAVNGFAGGYNGRPPAVVPGHAGAYVPGNPLHQGGHIGMPNPAYPNGYYNATAGGGNVGQNIDYNYVYSHPPDMSGMPPVRPEFTNTVNTMSDMAAQMGTCGYYNQATGWYTPGRPKPQRGVAPVRDFPTPTDK